MREPGTEASELRIRVRYAETDSMGVVHHSAYVVYLEEGRTELMRSLGVPYEEVERQGFAMGVRKMNLRYRRPARYGDVLLLRTWVRSLRYASIVFGYEARREGTDEVLLTGTVEIVCVELPSLKPVPTPPHVRQAVAPGARDGARSPD